MSEVVEVQASNPADEIVALRCQAKPGIQLTQAEALALKMEIVKAGMTAFTLKAGQFAKMRRGVADWHVSKSRSNDPSNKLMLSIVSIEEAAKKTNEKTGAVKTREDLIKEAIDKGLIKDADEVKDTADDVLREALGL